MTGKVTGLIFVARRWTNSTQLIRLYRSQYKTLHLCTVTSGNFPNGLIFHRKPLSNPYKYSKVHHISHIQLCNFYCCCLADVKRYGSDQIVGAFHSAAVCSATVMGMWGWSFTRKMQKILEVHQTRDIFICSRWAIF